MESIHNFLHKIVSNGSPLKQQETVTALSGILLNQLCGQPWFPNHDDNWSTGIAEEASIQIIDKLTSLNTRELDSSTIEKSVAEIASNLPNAIFYTPDVIRMIYSDHAPKFDALVNQGAEQHYYLVRRAASHAVRRHSPGMKRVSIDPTDLEEELWGVMLEELVRCMSDSHARVWRNGESQAIVFPEEGTRGSRRGIIMRIALSQDGSRIAAIRSDRMVFVWDIAQKMLIHSWNIDIPGFMKYNEIHERLYFSAAGDRLAVELNNNSVAVITIEDSSNQIKIFDQADRDQFLNEFGIPYLPERSPDKLNGFSLTTRMGQETKFREYCNDVYDWCCDEKGQTIAAASEIERSMPAWMHDAGFERAVFHIAKKRLIDLIRKRTHTNYACWQCGSMSSSMTDEHCRKCGMDFSRCPIGCDSEETLNASNRWKCSSCGMASRIAEPVVEIEVEDWHADSKIDGFEWRDAHDMDRILQALKKNSVIYKKIEIPCDVLVQLKSEGRTNEDIGQEVGIPRGSVDYVWNQCKQQILLSIGEI
jgi:ribosomal protein L40E